MFWVVEGNTHTFFRIKHRTDQFIITLLLDALYSICIVSKSGICRRGAMPGVGMVVVVSQVNNSLVTDLR